MTIDVLHRDLLASWNARDAAGYASLFTTDGSLLTEELRAVTARTERDTREGSL